MSKCSQSKKYESMFSARAKLSTKLSKLRRIEIPPALQVNSNQNGSRMQEKGHLITCYLCKKYHRFPISFKEQLTLGPLTFQLGVS